MQSSRSAEDKSTASNLYGVVAAYYIVPLVLYSIYALKTMSGLGAWAVTTVGLLVTTLGTANLLLQLRRWEFSMRTRVGAIVEKRLQEAKASQAKPLPTSYTPPEDNDRQMAEEASHASEAQVTALDSLEAQINGRDHAIQSLKQQLEELKQRSVDLNEQVKSGHQEAHHKETLLKDYQATIAEQRTIIDKKQQYISRLEAKVQDLSYEVKTLLQLGELGVGGGKAETQQVAADAAHPAINVFQATAVENPELDEMMRTLPVSSEKKVHTHYDAAVQLKKCIEQAQKLTGASHLGGESSRFLDLSVDSYAIDLRRLFDSFRNESSCTILLYTPSEDRVLFVNNQIKGLLGWSPEKFVKDFGTLVHSNSADWKHAVRQLDKAGEVQTRLVVKNRNGEEIPLHCYLGKIPEGAFAQHAIGILYPA